MKDDALIEKMARAMCAEMQPNKDPDELGPAPRGTLGLLPFWYRSYGRQARVALAVARKATLEAAISACVGEHIIFSNGEADESHNRAVDRCIDTLRALANQEQPQ